MTLSFGDGAKKVLELRDDLADEHDEATEEGIKTLQTSVKRNLMQEDSVARGVLLGDINTGRSLSTDPRVFTSRAVHLPDWAKYLEHGTGQRGATDTLQGSIPYPSPSGAPPFENILNWILAKNIQPTEYESRYALAEAIQQTIGAVGTFPHPFIRPSWRGPRGKRNIIQHNRRAIHRAVRRF